MLGIFQVQVQTSWGEVDVALRPRLCLPPRPRRNLRPKYEVLVQPVFLLINSTVVLYYVIGESLDRHNKFINGRLYSMF